MSRSLYIPRTVKWTLVDDNHKRFNRWLCDAGYIEAFLKGENPNVTNPYGQTSPLTKEELENRLKNERKAYDYQKIGKKRTVQELNDILDADARSHVLRG